MSDKISATIQSHFGNIEDPRCSYLNDHPLINILTIALCAIVAGAEGWTDVANFGRQKQAWLSQFLDLTAFLHMTRSAGSLPAWTPKRFARAFSPGCRQCLR